MATRNGCKVCYKRSTWDFLRDFYWRVGAANEYARKLENDIHEATTRVQQSQWKFTHCEAALLSNQETLEEERLAYRASREELTFEREKYQETLEILEKVFREAVRSGEVADFLGNQIVALQAASKRGVIQPTPKIPASRIETSLVKESLIPSEANVFIIQRNEPAKELSERYYTAFPGTPPRTTQVQLIASGATKRPESVKNRIKYFQKSKSNSVTKGRKRLLL
ncbi:hypothetical protein BDZ45DRAFT_753891 [Acephala macrosclerotiorum]|nr:hypothetical protein BDZ45DRAFT_753891 [Acephala macrosclerotiorum]